MNAAGNEVEAAPPAAPERRSTLHRIRRATGVALIALCAVGWIGVVVLPFLGLSAGRLAALIAILVIAAEGAFALGIVLLGKEIWQKFKAFLRSAKDAGEKT
mgnify:CR=1 FL=1